MLCERGKKTKTPKSRARVLAARKEKMFMRKPDRETAYRQLKKNLACFAACIAVIRITPYVLHFLSQEKEELVLEL